MDHVNATKVYNKINGKLLYTRVPFVNGQTICGELNGNEPNFDVVDDGNTLTCIKLNDDGSMEYINSDGHDIPLVDKGILTLPYSFNTEYINGKLWITCTDYVDKSIYLLVGNKSINLNIGITGETYCPEFCDLDGGGERNDLFFPETSKDDINKCGLNVEIRCIPNIDDHINENGEWIPITPEDVEILVPLTKMDLFGIGNVDKDPEAELLFRTSKGLFCYDHNKGIKEVDKSLYELTVIGLSEKGRSPPSMYGEPVLDATKDGRDDYVYEDGVCTLDPKYKDAKEPGPSPFDEMMKKVKEHGEDLDSKYD